MKRVKTFVKLNENLIQWIIYQTFSVLQEYTLICKVSFTVQTLEQMVRLYVNINYKSLLHIFGNAKEYFKNADVYEKLNLLKYLSSKNLKHFAVSYISRDDVSNSYQA